MSNIEEEEANLLIDFDYEVRLIRVIGNHFVSSNINISAEVIPLIDETSHDDFDIALSKCRFWLETVLSRSIAFFKENEHAAKMLLDEGKARCSNFLMITPFEPTDDHLACILQSKLTALANGAVRFGTVCIKSDNSSGLVFKFVGDSEDFLPDMEEWMDGKKTYFDQPWWNREDTSTFDVVPDPDDDLTKIPSWAGNLDFLSQAIRAPQNVVVRPDFKPKVIKGDKD